MKLELLNPYVMKVLIAVRKEDSISSISKRIGLSYGWTYKWIRELVEEGILTEKWRGVLLNEENESYKRIISFIRDSLNDIRFYYTILQLSGLGYALTKTDAVYVWTKGRYNIARFKEYYPIFIKVKRKDYPIFVAYCKRLNLLIDANKGVFFSVEVLDDFKAVRENNFFVEPLEETIHFMQANIYNFEPALEMVQEMYHKGFGVKYKEVGYL